VPLPKLLVDSTLCNSLSESKRAIQGGGVFVNNVREHDITRLMKQQDLIDGRFILIQVGKREKRLIDVRQS
jgi:tyrosyl-tRNA synthetase